MTKDWYSIENLEKAWKYAWKDTRDDFAFDVIKYEDLKHNKSRVLQTLRAQLSTDQYYPAPLIHIAVPKNKHSVRPGTVIPFIDLVVLYAIAQQLAPELDETLCDSAYAYRLNPKRARRDQLFTARGVPEQQEQKTVDEEEDDDEDIGFPYNWFPSWLAFHEASQEAAQEYEYVAVTDITAYFENISVKILFNLIRELLASNSKALVGHLEDLLNYWDWSSAAQKIGGQGLPQGNDVSSFLSNIYLIDLDNAMLEVVGGDVSKYHRYVDDVKVWTSDYDEARRALLELERVLRTLGLNIQSAKTQIKSAPTAFDPDITEWEQKLDRSSDERVEQAQEFFKTVLDVDDADSFKKWGRIYRRALTVLGQADDDTAVPTVLNVFCNNPSSRELIKSFTYLKRFISTHSYETQIFERLTCGEFLFPYHKAYLYRLAAYSRGVHEELKALALEEATDAAGKWFSRAAALFYLSTNFLSRSELSRVMDIVKSESDANILRPAYVVLAQHSGNELEVVLQDISFFNAPHQDYLRRYFFRLVRNEKVGQSICSGIRQASINAPEFISRLHQLDLVKANSRCRIEFRQAIEKQVEECSDGWPRLEERLASIEDAFIENP